MKPRVAIPRVHSTENEYAEKVMPQYCRAVEAAGGEAVEIPLGLSNEELAQLAKTCDAVLLPGSHADINPEKYGAVRDEHTAPDDPLRDNADELLLQDAYNMHKPVLGICFGLQSLNVWRTGSLMQHVADTAKHKGKEVTHRVTIERPSRLAGIVATAAEPAGGGAGATTSLLVNSSHHQAAEQVGDGLRAVAWADDGVIEAVESTSPEHWVIAVQWHPERMPDDPAAQALFHNFVEAARERRHRPRTETTDFESVQR